MFKIIYTIGFSIVMLALSFGIVLCAIVTIKESPKDIVSYYSSIAFIMFFYYLGITVGTVFLTLNIARLIINRDTLSIMMTIFSTGWVGYSAFLWVSHGFVI
jgi:hypothetical protein